MIRVHNVKVGSLLEKPSLELFTQRNSGNKSTWDSKQNKYIASEDYKYRQTNISGDLYHKNYIEYLEKCWSDHLIAVITPDIIWYTILCELALLVGENAEKYRYLFTDSKDKKEISVPTGDPVVIPLDLLIKELKNLVPTDVNLFLPTFSTSNEKSIFAGYAAFCDMVSPYYNYSMYCCGIPYIRVDGTKEDYSKLMNYWVNISGLFIESNREWCTKVSNLLSDIIRNLDSSAFWQKMFYLERCGSGSNKEVCGWWKDFYRVQPDLRYPHNYSTHISNVSYKFLNTGENFIMKNGLLFSKLEDDGLLVPQFGQIIYQKVS